MPATAWQEPFFQIAILASRRMGTRCEFAWCSMMPIQANTCVILACVAMLPALCAQGVLLDVAPLAHYVAAHPTFDAVRVRLGRVGAAQTADARLLPEIPILGVPLQRVLCISAGFLGDLWFGLFCFVSTRIRGTV